MVGLLIDWPVNRSWICWWESLPGMCRKRWNCCWDVVGMMSPGSTDALSSYMWFYNFLSWWLSYLMFPWKWTSAQTCFCCAVTSARVEAFVEATCKSWWKKSHCKSISSLRLRWDNSMGNHLFGILGMSIDECMFFSIVCWCHEACHVRTCERSCDRIEALILQTSSRRRQKWQHKCPKRRWPWAGGSWLLDIDRTLHLAALHHVTQVLFLSSKLRWKCKI